MALKYTNKNNVSLALAVFLMYDNYEYDERPNSISATGLIKPLRQLVLSKTKPGSIKNCRYRRSSIHSYGVSHT